MGRIEHENKHNDSNLSFTLNWQAFLVVNETCDLRCMRSFIHKTDCNVQYETCEPYLNMKNCSGFSDMEIARQQRHLDKPHYCYDAISRVSIHDDFAYK